ncbi:MAG TPA: SAP domain-containing protein, partial [Flavisolibacter sp.]|nr:SAP domain-containing protein [Flavisolibacter sp.]
MKRPDILSIQNGEELKRWYWLKQELVEYCKLVDLGYAGSKFDLLDRIANALDKKENIEPKSITS